MFLPAPFDLIEFDDASVADRGRSGRLLLHVNGLVTEPAAQVLLGWIGPSDARVTTATRRTASPTSPEGDGRSDAISIAGAVAPDGTGEPLLSPEEWMQLQSTPGAVDPRWHPAEAVLDDRPIEAEVMDVVLGRFGWFTHGALIVAFALHRLPSQNLRFCTVDQLSAAQYGCNPLAPRTYREFVDCSEAQFSQPSS